ncbi:MAG: hypothetical protein FWC97_09690 [Treponema sp.]|nr:hypothetical protein [Treponema sp.]
MAKAKAAAKKTSELDNLQKELKSLIPKLDEEGLAFLVKQAHIHLYNMQVDVLNETMIKDAQRKKASAAKTKTKAPKNEKPKIAGFSNVKMSGSGCHILYENQWISFTNSEITSMVKIAFGKDSDLEIRGRIYAWFYRERRDVLLTAAIANKFDEKLTSLITLLKSNFEMSK